MKKSNSFIVGIAGGSCSGKTTIAKALYKKHNRMASLIMFDDYFVHPGNIDLMNTDWENINLYDIEGLKVDIARLKAKKNINYHPHRENFETQNKTKILRPRKLIIIEGFLLFADPQIRDYLDLMIFLDIAEEEIIRRRLARKIENSPWDTEEYIYNKLLSGHRNYVLPTKVFAHHVIDSQKPINVVIGQIDNLIQTQLKVW